LIDIENELFSTVAGKVREKFPGIFMTGEYVKSPSEFPCVSLVEVDNAVLRNTLTNEGRENHGVVVYEVAIYSNKTKGKKGECKAIAAFLDELLTNLNFTRMMLEPIPNQDSATIYRMVGRYRAVVGRDHTIYRR